MAMLNKQRVQFFFVFTTPFASKMNHFGGLKLVNCLQFGLLSAPIVSRIAYTMSICLPFVRFVVTKQTKHNKQTKTQQQKQCVPLYSGLWTSCQIFGFLFLFWINPDYIILKDMAV